MSRDIRIDYVRLSELRAWPRNPKRHDLPTLHASLARFGFVNPIIVNEATGELLAGHGRVDALAERKARGEPPPDGVRVLDGEWLAPVVRGVSLPTEEAAAYAVADNAIGQGLWDDAALAEVLRGLAETPAGLDGVGYSEADLAALLASIAAAQPDEREDHPEVVSRADELQEQWQVERGQVWLCGRHRVMCGDSTDADDVARLMQGEKADVCWADPPYGINYSGGRTQVVRLKPYGRIPGDADADNSGFVRAALSVRACDTWICASPVNLVPTLASYDRSIDAIIVWDKGRPGLGYQWIRRQCEFVVFTTDRSKTKTDASEFDLWAVPPVGSEEMEHGAQKPVELIERALRFSGGHLVYDPFLGSGTTLIAAEKMGRVCYGMEIAPAYCAVVLQRYLDFTGNMPRLADA